MTTEDSSSTAGTTIGFSDWLRTLADGPPPIRDLAQDFIMGAEDGTNGSDYPTPEGFLEMIEAEGACDAAISTFEDAAKIWSELTGIPLVSYDDDYDDEDEDREDA